MMVMPQKESTAPESGKEERIKMSEQLFWSVNQTKRYGRGSRSVVSLVWDMGA